MTPRDPVTLEIRQPEGVSFEVDGWSVRWQKWRLRLGFTAREGLVLHTIGYQDGGWLRPVVHRPHRRAGRPVRRSRPFQGGACVDIGEYGIGIMTNWLELGCDCLGEIRYFDVQLPTTVASPMIKNAICLDEEDHGILWKHFDADLAHPEVRRSRRLVVSFIITAGNYDYAFYWYFYTDGSIELEIKLTGIVLTAAQIPGQASDYGTVVAPQTLAAHHQHFFSVRLDMAVDGPANSVYQVRPSRPAPGHPYRNALRPHHAAEHRVAGQRLIDPLTARHWLVVNPAVAELAGPAGRLQADPARQRAPVRARGCLGPQARRVHDRHLWVTPFAPRERFPAGEYPNQHPGGAGLPEWTKADRSIENTDIVLWYTLGNHHIPRPEDWPVMSAERVSFALKPFGFFDVNPSLDVPPPGPAGR